ncbi:MAG: type II toxin-antitoxin system VapC family toxin [Hadesarchaea archaeon]|nr:type II toxin-antitoxin system VapC family toxin [Hadesarchaea archaeon]
MKFVDSNVFIYVLDRHPKFGSTAKGILKRIGGGEEAATSTLVIEEVCAYLVKGGRTEEIPSFVDAIRAYGFLLKSPYIFEDVVTAREMFVKYKIDWNDLIIVAQMQREGIEEIYSNDADFDHVPGIKRIFE